MGIKLVALFGVFLVQYSRVEAYASDTDCADYCQKIRTTELQLDTNLFIFCRCGSLNVRLPRVTYGVVHPFTDDNDFSEYLQPFKALSNTYNTPYMPLSGYRTRLTRELNFQQFPENGKIGSFVGPVMMYKKPVTIPGQLHRDVIQSKLSSLEKQLTDLKTQTNRKNYFTNGNIAQENTLFDVLNEYGPPHRGQINNGVSYHNEIFLGKQSESPDPSEKVNLIKRSPPSYWSQNKYSVDSTIPQGRPMIMDMGLENKVEYRTNEENGDSRRIIESLDNFTTKENLKDCLNLLELQKYEFSDTMNKTMTMSFENLSRGKYKNYTAEEIASKIKVTCNDTYTLFRTGVEEINNKEKMMFDKMKISRSANPRMVQEYSSEELSEAPSVEAPSDVYWIDANIATQPFGNIIKGNQVSAEPISLTKKVSTSHSIQDLPKGSFHSPVQWQENGIVRDEMPVQNDPQTVSQLQLSTEDRPFVIEKERKVPKLVISENIAGLQSKFGELEKIDNNDFVRENNVAVIGSDTGNGNEASFDQINIIAKDHPDHPVLRTKQYDFVQWPLSLDNLYLTHRDLKLPMNFVPNANGKVDILIDGQYICDQLLREQNQSLLLLQILCNANNMERIQNLEKKMKTCSEDNAQNIVV